MTVQMGKNTSRLNDLGEIQQNFRIVPSQK